MNSYDCNCETQSIEFEEAKIRTIIDVHRREYWLYYPDVVKALGKHATPEYAGGNALRKIFAWSTTDFAQNSGGLFPELIGVPKKVKLQTVDSQYLHHLCNVHANDRKIVAQLENLLDVYDRSKRKALGIETYIADDLKIDLYPCIATNWADCEFLNFRLRAYNIKGKIYYRVRDFALLFLYKDRLDYIAQIPDTHRAKVVHALSVPRFKVVPLSKEATHLIDINGIKILCELISGDLSDKILVFLQQNPFAFLLQRKRLNRLRAKKETQNKNSNINIQPQTKGDSSKEYYIGVYEMIDSQDENSSTVLNQYFSSVVPRVNEKLCLSVKGEPVDQPVVYKVIEVQHCFNLDNDLFFNIRVVREDTWENQYKKAYATKGSGKFKIVLYDVSSREKVHTYCADFKPSVGEVIGISSKTKEAGQVYSVLSVENLVVDRYAYVVVNVSQLKRAALVDT